MFVPRIRSIKPEIYSHEGLYEAEMLYKLPLRVAYMALIACCDREGRFRWQPRRLKLHMLPYDDVDMAKVLDAFIEQGFIKKYEYKGELYGCIPSWSRHQKINNKEKDSDLPSIEDATEINSTEIVINQNISNEQPSVSDDCVTRESRVADACFIRDPRVADLSPQRLRGREEEGKRSEEEEKVYIVASGTRPVGVNQKIQNVFQHWKTVMKHPAANLDHKRKTIIEKALKSGYSEFQLCEAITGCSFTPHNMGDNDRGQRYDGLHVILRDGDQIDRFIHNCQYPPHPISDAERKNLANVQTLQGWMMKKMAEEK